MPKLIYDGLLEPDHPFPHPTVRHRVVEMDEGSVGVVFTQNRFPERFPLYEVCNHGAPITNVIETLADIVEAGIPLLLQRKWIRWFEHYAAPQDPQSPADASIIHEVKFVVIPKAPVGSPVSRFFYRIETMIQPWKRIYRYGHPQWKKLDPGEGSHLLGFRI